MTKELNHQDRGHSKYSSSGMGGLRKCPLKVFTSWGIEPDAPSPYAITGTFGHEVAEICLEAKLKGKAYPSKKKIFSLNKNYDEEMYIHGKGYAEFIWEKVSPFWDNDKFWAIEHRTFISTDPDRGGTKDFVFVYRDDEGDLRAILIDYKYGEGVRVLSEENDQLLEYCYATYLEVKRSLGEEIVHFSICIYQPRAKDIDEEDPSYICSEYSLLEAKVYWESMDEIVELSESFFKKYDVTDMTSVPESVRKKYQVAGDYQCRWCDGKGRCQAYKNKFVGNTIEKFSKFLAKHKDKPSKEKNDAITNHGNISEELSEELKAFIVNNSTDIKKFIDAVPKAVMSDFANGKPNPYLKIIRAKSRASWMEDEEALIAGLVKLGVEDPVRVETKPITITAAAEMIPGGKKAIEHLLKPTVETYRIVEKGHPEPAVSFGTDTKQMFKEKVGTPKNILKSKVKRGKK